MWLTLKSLARTLHRTTIDALHFPLRRRTPDPYHKVINDFNQLARSLPSPAILELGSRNVTGITYRQHYPNHRQYVGFDLHPGPGVDVAGDAHRLGDYFPPNHFDIVLAFSVFEHLLFPWKVVLEINKVMRPGGLLLLTTHPTWPAHELPADHWRFPKNAFPALFNPATGFQIQHCEEGLPAQAYSLSTDLPTRPLAHHLLYQGVALSATKTTDYQPNLLKWDINPATTISTIYPPPT